MDNLHNSDGFSANSENEENCCSSDQGNNSSCCPPATPLTSEKKGGFKNNLGMLLLGFAFILAISSAFKIATATVAEIPLSINDFEWMDTDKEVAFVLIKGEDKEENKRLSAHLSDVIAELNDSEESAAQFELTSTFDQYEGFVKTTGASSEASVVVLGRLGNPSILDIESISAIKLYKAYLTAISPASSCDPASCDPSKSCSPSKTCDPSKSCTPAQKAACGVKKSN